MFTVIIPSSFDGSSSEKKSLISQRMGARPDKFENLTIISFANYLLCSLWTSIISVMRLEFSYLADHIL